MKNLRSFEKKLIDSKNHDELCERLKCNDNNELLNKLVKYLEIWSKQINKIGNSNKFIIEKAVVYIYTIINDSNLDRIKLFDKISFLKQPFVTSIKKDKKERTLQKNLNFLRKVVGNINKIEILCLNYANDNYSSINNNLIDYVLFEEENLNASVNFINEFPYLINVYIADNNILDKSINQYFKYLLLSFYDYEYRDKVIYYKNIISSLLNNSKLKIKNEDISNALLQLNGIEKKNILNVNNKKIYSNHIKYLKNLLTSATYYEPNINSIGNIYNIKINFSKFDTMENFVLNKRVEEGLKQNREYVKAYTFTIDDHFCLCRDDAISIETLSKNTYRLGVHITDVNAYLNRFKGLKEEVLERCSNIYLEDDVIEMIPFEFIKTYLSLDEKETRLVTSYFFDIDSSGNIKDFNIEKSIINVDKNLSYQEADQIINGKESNEVGTALRKVNKLVTILKNKNNLNYILENIEEEVADNKSQKLIETCMVMTNKTVAEYFKDNNLPFIYKIFYNDQSIPENIKESICKLSSIDKSYYSKIVKALENNFAKSKYSINPCGHEGLMFEAYSNVTSPIRRSADIIANDCIDYYYFGIGKEPSSDKLKERVKYLNTRNNEILEYYKEYTLARINN